MLQLARRFCLSSRQYADFSHVVIGGGVVGTAIAAELQKIPGNSVSVLEQHEKLGMETTSRNSEVIHAGLYYPADSLKAKFCIRGKQLIYEKVDPHIVPYSQCGKWVVAQSEEEQAYIEKLHKNADALGVPVSLVSAKQAARQFPMISAKAGALESPTTGIILSHDLTLFFHTQFENEGGTVAINTKVDDMEFESAVPQYRLLCTEKGLGEQFEITTDNVVNLAGLFAQEVANMVLPKERHFKSYFAKGSYYAYAPENPIPTSKITSKLIYPCPNPNASSLGTHLTFDLGGQLRFGPDLEWVDVQSAADLDYDVSAERIAEAAKSIATYFPNITSDQLQPSYSGVRPKLLSQEDSKKKFADYYIKEEDGFPGFVNLVGIESPGLTSSWAIAEHVARIYR